MNKKDISIIIVNYNSGELLLNCIESILKNIKNSFEIIIVDNNSTDNSFENTQIKYGDRSNLIFHNTTQNIGFAKANNIGFNLSSGRLIHFLNPDTQLAESNSEDYNLILSKKKESEVYNHSLIDSSSNIIPSKNTFPIISNYLNKFFNRKRVFYWYTGASVIIWRNFFERIGKWPTEYFMYSEDMDLYYSIQRNSGDVIELRNSILHIGGGCSTNVWNNLERLLIIQKSFKLFYKKYDRNIEYYIISAIHLAYKLIKYPREFITYLKIFIKSK